MTRWAPVVALALPACFGTPVPLAPGVGGSVGAPHHGVLTNAVELPLRGDGFVRYRQLGSYNWGNPRLVRTVELAAANVAKKAPGGFPLIVGDLSAKSGGKIPRHQSHRTGRDVDLPWFVTTPAGVPVQNPGFVNMGPDGLARLETTGEYVRLDIERQWLLVKELLTSPEADVEWMFSSKEVEALLIDYARARGEPNDLVWRAETVLIQPGNSLPHDDHIHLRIACTTEEAVLGCEAGGPRWEWLTPFPTLPGGSAFLYEIVREDPPPPRTDSDDGTPDAAPAPKNAASVQPGRDTSPVTGEPPHAAPSG